ncbi:MAG: hypothetical protein RBU29_11750, partial [bacterium]|nr:hypothetical protein [bacterium]
MHHRFLFMTLALLALLPASHGQDLIPFGLPWDDGLITAPSVLRVEDREIPAGKNGFIRIEDGRFVDGTGRRIRFLGVNLCFSADFPTHAQAEAIAVRMAKYGINCVRFHHTDTNMAPSGIWKTGLSTKQVLDPEMLDRLDYLIYCLKQNGIFSDLNLKVGREVVSGDGFTEVDKLPTFDKGPDHYVPRMIELQKNYARDLLTHVNPYTKTAYVDEPAIAIVEINNESGLVGQWGGNDLDPLPPVYIEPLQTGWNTFLQNKYQTTAVLQQAWAPDTSGSETEMMPKGVSGFSVEQTAPARAVRRLETDPDLGQVMKVDITSLSSQAWHAQTYYTPLRVKKGLTAEA